MDVRKRGSVPRAFQIKNRVVEPVNGAPTLGCPECATSAALSRAQVAQAINVARRNRWPFVVIDGRGKLLGPSGERIAPPIRRARDL